MRIHTINDPVLGGRIIRLAEDQCNDSDCGREHAIVALESVIEDADTADIFHARHQVTLGDIATVRLTVDFLKRL